MTAKWPTVQATITRRFRATHSLCFNGQWNTPHQHDYTLVVGFKHEMPPSTCLVGSKALAEWDKSISPVVELLDGANLNALMDHPTLEMLTLWVLAKLPAYFDWVELQAYEPLMTARIERKGADLSWVTR